MEAGRSTGCASPTPASPAWPTACATVAALPDPVGEVLDGWRRPNGLQIERGPGAARRRRDHLREPAQRHQRRRRPLPEVGQRRAAARLGDARCARTSPSPTVLRDGARPRPGSPRTRCVLVDDVRHEAAIEVMQLTDYVDCLIPRGGPALIQSIRDNATVPVIIDGDGNCHVYVDASADLDTRARHRGQRQDAAPERVQRGRVARRARGGRRRVPARVSPTRSPSTASSSSATPAPRRRCRRMGEATDDDFGARVPRPEAERRGRAVARRRDRARQPLRHRAHRGDPHPRPRRGPPLHRRGRRRPPSW